MLCFFFVELPIYEKMHKNGGEQLQKLLLLRSYLFLNSSRKFFLLLMQITTYTLMQNKYHVMAAASSPKIGNLELHTLSSSPTPGEAF